MRPPNGPSDSPLGPQWACTRPEIRGVELQRLGHGGHPAAAREGLDHARHHSRAESSTALSEEGERSEHGRKRTSPGRLQCSVTLARNTALLPTPL
ncbi:hypothetical protein OH77DRAFT_314116 [Trametes cingulata]|nr:hypothetical protein OH77DRAFT_314116 [Trametes cingulata]